MSQPGPDDAVAPELPPTTRHRWKLWLWVGLLLPVVVIATFCFAADLTLNSEPDNVAYNERASLTATEEAVEEALDALPEFAGFTEIDESMTPHNRDGFGSDDYASFAIRAVFNSDMFNSERSEANQRNEFARSVYEHWGSAGYVISQSDIPGAPGNRVRAEREDGITLVFDSSVEPMLLTLDTGWVELNPLRHSSGHASLEWSPDLDHLRHPDSEPE